MGNVSTDSFNLGLFYEFIPNKTYQLMFQKYSDGKLNKIRIKGLAVTNAVRDKVSCVCDWQGQKATVLQELEVFTMSLQKSMKKLGGCSIVKIYQVVIPPTEHNFLDSANGPGCIYSLKTRFSKNSGIQLEKPSIIIILFNSEVNLQLV